MAQSSAEAQPGRDPWAEERTPADELLDILRSSRPAWHADAACREPHEGATWFPLRGQDAMAAKRVCQTCLVLEECRSWALAQDVSLQGTWGGQSKRERDKARLVSSVDASLRVPSPWPDTRHAA